MTDARDDAALDRPRTRQVELGGVPFTGVPVTAVVVTRGVTDYLPQTLTALAGQTHPPQRVLVVDADAGLEPGADQELHRVVTASLPAAVLVPAPGARTFGHAVRAALAAVPTVPPAGAARSTDPAPDPGPVTESAPRWLWLLHDDSAPEPTALAELLSAVEIAPSVAVAGCKQRSWSGPVRVLEVGLATSRFGRRMTGLDEPEVDQGQHDGREDVLGVGIAGALVRRDVWDDLGGTDPALGPYGDGLDLSRRARLAGHRVIVVPRAVVRHAQASLAHPIGSGGSGAAVLNRPGWDARRSAQARREAYLHSQLVGVPAGLVPVVVVLAVVSGVVRGLGRFVTKEPHLVVAELAAPWAVLVRPGRVVRARRVAAATRRVRRGALRRLQVTWREVAGQERDRRLTAAEQRRNRQAPSELELRELAALRTRRRTTLAGVLLLAVVVTGAALGPLVTRVLAGARLSGGALPYGDAGPADLWATATSGWVSAGLGEPGPPDPLLTALLPVTVLTGTIGHAAALVLLGSLVLAATGAWFAAGAVTRSTALRAWAALVWVGAPTLLLALGQARLGAVLAHATLPWVGLGVARAVGVARVDAVASGLVGAQRAGAAEREPGGRAVGTAVVATAEPSLAAAAGAGLAFAVVVAGAPVLLPFGLLALLGVTALARRRRRLVWVALPALVLQGPVLVSAIGSWSDGGWRMLLADPGQAVVESGTGSPQPWQQLLGWPVEPPAWVDLPTPVGELVPLLATGVVALVALLALTLGGAAGRAVRVGWLVAACGLTAAVVADRAQVVVADDAGGSVLTTAWSGPGVSLALLGLLVAAVAGGGGAREAIAGHTFGWRQVGAAALTVVAVVGPAAVVGAWSWHTRTAGDLAMTTSDVPVVPAVARQMQTSPDAVRILSLAVTPDGQVDATLLRHDGVQLTELSRTAAARAVTGPLDRPVPADPDAAEVEVADAAARLATGTSDEVAADLAELGIGAVLVPPALSPEQDAGRSTIVGRIDSTADLERVTETASGIIWRVGAGEQGTSAWARLLAGPAGSDGGVLAAVPSSQGRIDTALPPADDVRLLVLAERSDAGWQAAVDGRPLRAVESSWRQAFEVGPDGGQLLVRHVPPARGFWLALQGVVVLATVLLAVPVRRRRGGSR